MRKRELLVAIECMEDTDVRVEVGPFLADVSRVYFDFDREAIVVEVDPDDAQDAIQGANGFDPFRRVGTSPAHKAPEIHPLKEQ